MRFSIRICVYFDYVMVHNVRLYVENAMSNFAKRQRSKMTSALREYIKKRDHYTCQICGDNILCRKVARQ